MPDAVLSDNYRKSELSYAYLHALAAICGYTCQKGPDPDVDSVDAMIGAKGAYLHVQLKATSSPMIREDGLHFQLGRKNYDDIRNPFTPTILVVLELPEEQDEWLECDAEGLVMRRRAWWKSLKGSPDIETDSKVIIMPESQKLDPDSFRLVMDMASRWEI